MATLAYRDISRTSLKTVSSISTDHTSNIVVRAFDGPKRMVHWEVDTPIKDGTQTFDSTFYVMDIRPSYSCLLGRLWIHNAGAVTSMLHQMLKYPIQGKIITVHGEEEYMVSHLNSFRYVELDGEFIETPFQHFEEVPQDVAVIRLCLKFPRSQGLHSGCRL